MEVSTLATLCRQVLRKRRIEAKLKRAALKEKEAASSEEPMKLKYRNVVKGHEHISSINYLYQASEAMLKLHTPQTKLAGFYGQVLSTISEKSSVKLDFTMKRSICKKCKTILVPGLNMTYRLKRRKNKSKSRGKNKPQHFPTQVITCKSCGTYKTFSTLPNYQLKDAKLGKIVGTSDEPAECQSNVNNVK